LGRSDVAVKALKVLKRIAEKEPDFFQTGLANGLAVAADFQDRLRQAFFPAIAADAGMQHMRHVGPCKPGLPRHQQL
jgi:hypothetical protein